MKPSLLILSFSPIASDARVLKQVEAFRDDYAVTTCGYGPTPDGVARHVRIPDDVLHNVLHDGRITRKAYKRAYWSLWSVKWVRKHLKRGAYDIVLADDVEAVPLALRLRPKYGTHADLHEYSPLLHEDWEGWRAKITPYVEWLCSEYVAHADSWSTVSGGLAREYERNFGFRPVVVTNAAPYVDAEPRPVGDPIRLVHSGAALHDRKLEDLVAGVAASTSGATLDLYLTPNQPAFVEVLRGLAAETDGRVRVNDPVPYAQLSETLQGYDVGVHMLAPTNFNNRWALPNKLFDYVQARLGVIIGPSPEMAEYVQRYGLGAVTESFEPAALAAVLDGLTVADVERWKKAADASARELSAATQVQLWKDAIDALARRGGASAPRNPAPPAGSLGPR
ncbi:Glycosyl transferases group 1 [Microbacterium sp. cf046]|uniref:glycosyltransferase n=1 Tax=Microbacterium sp. cf046 TaxID=1761803 RepID=UPI0008F109B5|nr:glycosyltransferase [Microbacterium sp. cf046]SFR95695.1 Glycosyl transferases group 1 [Microbacterium sp. cf046]